MPVDPSDPRLEPMPLDVWLLLLVLFMLVVTLLYVQGLDRLS